MTPRELNSCLKRYVGGYWGHGNMLFDRNYRFPTMDELSKACKFAAKELAWFQYGKDKSDCDSYHIMWLGKMKEHFIRNAKGTDTEAVGVIWGDYEDYGHMWGFAMTGPKEFHHINYGKIATPSHYKGEGSMVV